MECHSGVFAIRTPSNRGVAIGNLRMTTGDVCKSHNRLEVQPAEIHIRTFEVATAGWGFHLSSSEDGMDAKTSGCSDQQCKGRHLKTIVRVVIPIEKAFLQQALLVADPCR